MTQLKNYMDGVLGTPVHLQRAGTERKLPLYLKSAYTLYLGSLFGRQLTFAVATEGQAQTVGQIGKHLQTIRELTDTVPVLVLPETDAITRKRLIEKRINFVVTGKQMYLPDLLLDLREDFGKKAKGKGETLLPSAQLIVLQAILKRGEPVERYPLKELARKLGYTAMAMSQAAANLQACGLCEIKGTKEKYLHLPGSTELWERADKLLTDPVMLRVYVDELPAATVLPKAGESALPHFTSMNPSQQEYRALAKGTFYELRKRQGFKNPNDREGTYCLEVWKYDPLVLGTAEFVDPVSLYLSLRHNTDERIQMALGELADLW